MMINNSAKFEILRRVHLVYKKKKERRKNETGCVRIIYHPEWGWKDEFMVSQDYMKCFVMSIKQAVSKAFGM